MARFPRLVHSTFLALGLLPLGACVDSGDGDDGNGNGNDTGADDGADAGADDDGNPDDGGDDGGDGGDPPTAAEIDGCRETCDRLLTFDCLDADTHEACWAICPDRTGAAIAQFDACVSGTLPECAGCWENFLDADPPATDDGAADSAGDDGSVGEATCEDACEEWLGAGCPPLGEFESCAGFCAAIPESAHDLVVQCVESRDGCTLPESCTFEEGGSQGGG